MHFDIVLSSLKCFKYSQMQICKISLLKLQVLTLNLLATGVVKMYCF